MFNDKFSLTQAVLEGRKTMTRRICKEQIRRSVFCESGFETIHGYEVKPKYEIGEVVAIAQSYMDLEYDPNLLDRHPKNLSIRGLMKDSAGWNNKMFVKSYACKHHIKITGIKVERLQDISDEDCLKEGIIHAYTTNDGIRIYHTPNEKKGYLSTDVAQEAFAYLIDKVSGKGMFASNPYVFVYEFKLVD